MKKLCFKSGLLMVLVSLFYATCCHAHFGMVIPSDNMVMQQDSRTITVDLSFSHPFEMVGMDLVRPEAVFVVHQGKRNDLLETLNSVQILDQNGWETSYRIKRPGAYIFCMTPKPYWEPAEDCYIIHYTKTVVAAFGSDQGWDSEIGLKTEIIPLSKPFGLYAGNVFQGIVKLDSKPVAYAEVEIEYYNENRKVSAPADYMITQTIKADQNGVFTYAAPKHGWWGFAALNTSDKKMTYKGEQKDIEIGAVLWVKFEQWQETE